MLLSVHDTVEVATAYQAELSERMDQPVLSDAPVLQRDLQLPDASWEDLADTMEKVSAAGTDRIAVRRQYIDRAIPEPGSTGLMPVDGSPRNEEVPCDLR